MSDANIHDQNNFEIVFGVLCNMPLLCDHTASWEILVPRQCMSYSHVESNNATAAVPVSISLNNVDDMLARIVEEIS